MRLKQQESAEWFLTYGLHIPTRTIVLVNEITSTAFRRFLKAFHILESLGTDPVTIIMSSPGGSVVDGYGIFDLISNSNCHVTIKVFGEACSMAALILQAADHRIMSARSMLLLHDGEINGEDGKTLRDFEKSAEHSKRERSSYYKILSDRTGKPVSYFRRKLAHDWHLDAKGALAEQLVDEILEG